MRFPAQSILSFTRRPCLRLAVPHQVGHSGARFASSTHDSNQSLVEVLTQRRLKELQSANKDQAQLILLARAINVVSSLDYPLRSSTQLKSAKGVGKGVLQCIDKLLGEWSREPSTGSSNHPESTLIEHVPRIKRTTVRALVEAGCRTLEDLRRPKYQAMLTHSQRSQFLYEQDLQQPISIEASEAIRNFLQQTLSKPYSIKLLEPFHVDQVFSSIVILLHHPSHADIPLPTVPKPSDKKLSKHIPQFFPGTVPYKLKSKNELYRDIIPTMESQGLLVSSSSTRARCWKGIVRIPNQNEQDWERAKAIREHSGQYRKMELYLVPEECSGAAQLALSSRSEYYQELRERAYCVGWHLNEFGLWRWEEGGEAGGGWALTEARSVEDILMKLGLIMRD